MINKKTTLVLIAIFACATNSSLANENISFMNSYVNTEEHIRINDRDSISHFSKSISVELQGYKNFISHISSISFETTSGIISTAKITNGKVIRPQNNRLRKYFTYKVLPDCASECRIVIGYPLEETEINKRQESHLKNITLRDSIGIPLGKINVPNKKINTNTFRSQKWLYANYKKDNLNIKISENLEQDYVNYFIEMISDNDSINYYGVIKKGSSKYLEVPHNIDTLTLRIQREVDENIQDSANVVLYDKKDPFFAGNDTRWRRILTKGLLNNDMGITLQ